MAELRVWFWGHARDAFALLSKWSAVYLAEAWREAIDARERPTRRAAGAFDLSDAQRIADAAAELGDGETTWTDSDCPGCRNKRVYPNARWTCVTCNTEYMMPHERDARTTAAATKDGVP